MQLVDARAQRRAEDGAAAAATGSPAPSSAPRSARGSTTLHGIDYVVFVIPGLIMMAWAINSFSNNSSSILQQKFQGAIHDQLSSPASPVELLLALTFGGFLRGMIVATLTYITATSWSASRSSTARPVSRRYPSSACSSPCSG